MHKLLAEYESRKQEAKAAHAALMGNDPNVTQLTKTSINENILRFSKVQTKLTDLQVAILMRKHVVLSQGLGALTTCFWATLCRALATDPTRLRQLADIGFLVIIIVMIPLLDNKPMGLISPNKHQ